MTENIQWRRVGGVLQAVGHQPAHQPRPTAPPNDLRTVAEIARQLRVSKMTIYRLAEAGDLPSKRIGRSIRIAQSAVNAYMQRAEGYPDEETA